MKKLLCILFVAGLLGLGMPGPGETGEYRTYYVDVDVDGDGRLDKRRYYVDLFDEKTFLYEHDLKVDSRSMLRPYEIIKKFEDGTVLKRDRTGRYVFYLPDGSPHMCSLCFPYLFSNELDFGFHWHVLWWRIYEALEKALKDERSGRALDAPAGSGTLTSQNRLFVYENGRKDDLQVSIPPMQTGWARYVAPLPSSVPYTGNASSGSLQDARTGGGLIYRPPKQKPEGRGETWGSYWVRYHRDKGDHETADWFEPYVKAEDKKAFGRELSKQIPSLPPLDPHTFHTSNYYGNESPPVIVQPPVYKPDELYRVREKESPNGSIPQVVGKESVPVQGVPVLRQPMILPQGPVGLERTTGTAPTYQPVPKGAQGGVGAIHTPLSGGADRGK